ncbi:MAG: CaiB/BaiF CoA-transferase family protein [Actinomycetota bacterium]|nr:CaiB/BaiF CoA-transferase family protein [Actinomycetota bacterium]
MQPSSDPRAAPVGPLAGVLVIELGQLIAGPFAGQLLGDLGADVVKIELPGTGDPMRQWGQLTPEGESLWWSVIGRNKKSVTLDVRTDGGRSAVLRLVALADVLIENFRPGTLEKWGLSYEALREVNPGIVVVRVSGFGQTGPYTDRAGFGAIGEAMGGLRAVVGDPDRPPVRTGIAIGDALSGALGALGALAALLERRTSGQGQVLDVALYESVLAFMESLIPDYVTEGWIRPRTGATLPGVAPSNVYPTLDGRDVLIAGNQDSVFRRLTEVMGAEHLADDPRYATHTARGERQRELDALVSAWTATVPSADLLELLAKAGVPAGPIYRAPDMLEDPHFMAREAIVTVPHPVLGSVTMQNVFPRASRTPGSIRWAGPTLGEHTDEVLAGMLGLSPSEITSAQGSR